jgi:hypothetical protein
VPTSCKPVEVVRSRKSTGMAVCTGAGSFQARPGRVSTRTGSPNWLTTTACPAPTMIVEAASTAATTIAEATTNRTAARSLGCVPTGSGSPWSCPWSWCEWSWRP